MANGVCMCIIHDLSDGAGIKKQCFGGPRASCDSQGLAGALGFSSLIASL